MAAQYPAGVKSFTPIVDGVDYPQATQINQVYDEVSAMQAALLTTGLAHHLLFVDATYDIGASGATRPRDLFLSRNAVIGGTLAVTGTVTAGQLVQSGAANDLHLNANGASNIIEFRINTSPKVYLSAAGNLGIAGSTFGTDAVGVLGLTNATVPTTSPADMVQLFSVDASAGNATLGLRTEAAVASESVTSDRTLQVVINGTVYKVCLKS